MQLDAAVSGYANVLERTQHAAEARAFENEFRLSGKLKKSRLPELHGSQTSSSFDSKILSCFELITGPRVSNR